MNWLNDQLSESMALMIRERERKKVSWWRQELLLVKMKTTEVYINLIIKWWEGMFTKVNKKWITQTRIINFITGFGKESEAYIYSGAKSWYVSSAFTNPIIRISALTFDCKNNARVGLRKALKTLQRNKMLKKI